MADLINTIIDKEKIEFLEIKNEIVNIWGGMVSIFGLANYFAENVKSDGFIDHQSINLLQDKSLEDMLEIIFNNKIKIFLDNDN